MAAERVYLACSGGFSTSVLVKKLTELAAERGVDVTIEFISEMQLGSIPEDTLLVLLAPQVAFRRENLRRTLPSENIALELIDRVAYGRADAEAVLRQIEQRLQLKE